MSRTCVDPNPISANENDDKWVLAVRIASSRQFAKAPQLKDILLYVCQRALADPSTAIKEQEIGCKVLGRKPDFNPHEDNIVRVQISHVRRKLDEYFASDGKDEPIQITIPKGSYVPRFQSKPQEAPPVPVVAATPALVPVLAIAATLLALACAYLLFRPIGRPTAANQRPAAQEPFWGRILGGSQPTSVVVSDTNTVMLQDVLDMDLSAADYAGGHYAEKAMNNIADKPLRSALQVLASRQYTSLADLTLSNKMMEVSRQFGLNQASIRYARHLNVRDFKNGNFVFLGSRRGIPWVELFESQLNFVMQEDKKTQRFYFRNKAPRPGEPTEYVPVETGRSLNTYSDIAVLPNLGHNGVVLILLGLTMVDTESAGEFLSRKNISEELSRILGAEIVRDRYFEILLKTRAVAGAAESAQIETFRVLQ